jgi:hypothetical protein
MDHHEQHHQQHEKEREEKKKHEKEYERKHEGSGSPLHPAWLFGVGIALALAAIVIWTMFLS